LPVQTDERLIVRADDEGPGPKSRALARRRRKRQRHREPHHWGWPLSGNERVRVRAFAAASTALMVRLTVTTRFRARARCTRDSAVRGTVSLTVTVRPVRNVRETRLIVNYGVPPRARRWTPARSGDLRCSRRRASATSQWCERGVAAILASDNRSEQRVARRPAAQSRTPITPLFRGSAARDCNRDTTAGPQPADHDRARRGATWQRR